MIGGISITPGKNCNDEINLTALIPLRKKNILSER